MAPQPKVLFVLTSQNKLGNSDHPTGWYLPELAHPYEVLHPHAEIVVASPAGGEAPLDPGSVEAFKSDAVSQDFLKSHSAVYKQTQKLANFVGRAGEFDAIFYVGGHGPMFDLAGDEVSHRLVNEFRAQNKVVAAVCHGPAALAKVKSPGGGYFLEGLRVTGFSNEEEDVTKLTSLMPFSLEDQLNTASGGLYEKAPQAWGPKVVVSNGGKLITGQNPASAAPVGQAILDAITGGGQAPKKDEV